MGNTLMKQSFKKNITNANNSFEVNKDKPNLLLVEGSDDYHFFMKFFDGLNIKNIHIEPYRGNRNSKMR